MTAKKLIKWELPEPPDKSEHSRLVGLLSDPDDYHAVLLASMGMSYRVIQQQTGLSSGQISYRLKKANTQRANGERISSLNYRNGTSPVANAVIQIAINKVARLVTPELRKTAIDIG